MLREIAQLDWVFAKIATTTDTELIATPGVGKQIVIRTIMFSTDGNMSMELLDASVGTKIAPTLFAAVNSIQQIWLDAPVGENKALFASQSSVSNGSYAIGYNIVPISVHDGSV